jgi:hypothetical protein
MLKYSFYKEGIQVAKKIFLRFNIFLIDKEKLG